MDYINQLYRESPFHFKLSRPRNTKQGDYQFIPKTAEHIISVNGDLSPEQFLFTLIHEIAHQRVRIQLKKRVSPHGQEWKQEFRRLILPVLRPEVFNENTLRLIARHMKNPKASSSSDPVLHSALQNREETLLNDLEEGQRFRIGKRVFIKGPKRRTRFLCYLEENQRKYTISAIAPVDL